MPSITYYYSSSRDILGDDVEMYYDMNVHPTGGTGSASNFVGLTSSTMFTVPANTICKVVNFSISNFGDHPTLYTFTYDTAFNIEVVVNPKETLVLAKENQPLYLPIKGTTHNLTHKASDQLSIKTVMAIQRFEF
jgi:hypothetical protein